MILCPMNKYWVHIDNDCIDESCQDGVNLNAFGIELLANTFSKGLYELFSVTKM